MRAGQVLFLVKSVFKNRLSTCARRGTRTPTVLPTSTSSLFIPTSMPPFLFPGTAIPRLIRWVAGGNTTTPPCEAVLQTRVVS
jgi:hypothetical protein